MSTPAQIFNFNKNSSSKVLIVLMGSIGDVVRGLPLAVRLKRAYPSIELHWAVEPKSLGVLERHPAIDKVILFERPRGFRAYIEFIRKLRAEKYDLVLDLQRHFKSGVTSFATGARRRVGFARINAKEFNWIFNNSKIDAVENFSPKIYHYQKFADLIQGDVQTGILDFGLESSARDLELMRAKLKEQLKDGSARSFIGLILGSSWPSRFWCAESYACVIEEVFKRYGAISVLIGGPAEVEFKEKLLPIAPAGAYIDLVGKVALADLKHLFRLMRLALGPDSGPMHICAAAGTPVISLWGATSPARSAPYGSEQYVLSSNVSCSPCYLRECPGLGQICMKQIWPEMVLDKMAQIFAGADRFEERA